MATTATSDRAPDVPLPASSRRITGIDLARAVAMLGMVIVHYAWPSDQGSWALNFVAQSSTGRAMPLFLVLGGIGISILVARSPKPDHDLLVRAAILLPMGLVLQELTTWIAIILQSYALYFVAAVLFRRFSSRALLVAAMVVTGIGGYTYQVTAGLPRYGYVGDLIDRPVALVWSLLVNGYYPFLPTVAFLLVGLWLGRLDLGSRTVAWWLAGGGAAVGFGTYLVAERLIGFFDIPEAAFEPTEPAVFVWTRLLDPSGHSQMPVWVLSSAATAVAVLGVSLLVARRVPRAVHPLVMLGQLALTFYVFQAILVNWTPNPETTPIELEFAIVAAIYLGFMAYAVLWRRAFRRGPLEQFLRLGAAKRP
jgi:uncharacterized membrane protein YeiB